MLLVFSVVYKTPRLEVKEVHSIAIQLNKGTRLSMGTETSQGMIGFVYSASENTTAQMVLGETVRLELPKTATIEKLTMIQKPAISHSFVVEYRDKKYLCKVNYLNSSTSECIIDFNSYTINSDAYLTALDIALRLVDYYYLFVLVIITSIAVKKIS